MHTTVYLPDKLHQMAKESGINFSGLLREAIEAELYQDNPTYFETLKKREMDKLEKQKFVIEQLEKLEKKAKSKKKRQSEKIAPSADDVIMYGE